MLHFIMLLSSFWTTGQKSSDIACRQGGYVCAYSITAEQMNNVRRHSLN